MDWWQDGTFTLDPVTPWRVLDEIERLIENLGETLGYPQPISGLWISPTARIAPSAALVAPCLVMDGAEVGEWAYLRGNCILGRYARTGHAVEVKNSLLMEGAIAAHFNYVGDSVLGAGAHLGAGAVCSNLRLDGRRVRLTWLGKRVDSGRRKLGALVGAHAQVACNVALNPGTVVEPDAWVLPAERIEKYVVAKRKDES